MALLRSGAIRVLVTTLTATILTFIAPGGLQAQLVRGRITSASTALPLAGALITLEDSAGAARLRAVSTASGMFAFFAPRSGQWRLRVAAIGYDPSPPQPVTVADSGAVVVEVAMVTRPFQLPTLVVSAKGEACATDSLGAAIVARLMREAETALRLVDATVESRRLEFVSELWGTRAFVGSSDTTRASERVRNRASWPIASADGEALRRGGFVRDTGGVVPMNGYLENSGPIYYGPDAAVLFAPWFRESHCFVLDAPQGEDSLVVRFTPKRTPRATSEMVDVAGTLVLERSSLSLRRLTFRYVGLPRWVPGQSAGGELGFERLSSGLWVATSWQMRAPIRLQGRWGQGSASFGGWAEGGGRVVEIVETTGTE